MDKARKSFWFIVGFAAATAAFLMLGPQRASGQPYVEPPAAVSLLG